MSADSTPALRRLDWLLPGTLLLLAVVPPLGYLTTGLTTPDEIMLILYPMEVMHGRVPNVDFYTVYGAPMFQALGVLYQVVGADPTAERLVGLGYHVALAFGVFALTRRFGRLPAWCGAAVTCLLLADLGLVAFAWLGALSLLTWSLVLISHENSRWRWVVAGLLGGLSVGWRYEYLVIAGLATIPWLVGHRRWRFALPGAIVAGLPTAVHVLPNFSAVYDNVYAGRVAGNFQVDLTLVDSSVFVGLGLCGVATIGLLVAGARTRDRWFLSTGLASLAMLPQAAQRIDAAHLAYVGCFVLPMALAPVLGSLRVAVVASRTTRPVQLLAAAVVAAVIVLQGSVAGVALADPPQVVQHGDRALRLSDEWAANTRATIADLQRNVPVGSNVFVGAQDMSVTSSGFFPLFYLLGSDYRFDQYYLELAAGVAERDGSGLDRDIERADALILWDVPAQVTDALFPNLPQGDHEANDAVRDGFCRATVHGPLALYLPC